MKEKSINEGKKGSKVKEIRKDGPPEVNLEDKSLGSRRKELMKNKRKLRKNNFNIDARKKRKLVKSDGDKEEKLVKCTQLDLDKLAFKATQIDNIMNHEPSAAVS